MGNCLAKRQQGSQEFSLIAAGVRRGGQGGISKSLARTFWLNANSLRLNSCGFSYSWIQSPLGCVSTTDTTGIIIVQTLDCNVQNEANFVFPELLAGELNRSGRGECSAAHCRNQRRS